MKKRWCREDEEYLYSRRGAGESYKSIARSLGRSPKSLKTKYYRLCSHEYQHQDSKSTSFQDMSESTLLCLTDQQIAALTAARQKEVLTSLRRLHRQSLRKETHYMRLAEDVKSYIKALPHPTSININPIERTTEVEEAVLLLSDFHLGEVVSKDQMGGAHQFNLKIAERRLNNLVNIASDLLLNKLSGYHIPRLHIFLLGDMVSGSIHDELAKNLEFDEPVIIVEATKMIAEVIRQLSRIVSDVKVYCFTGNHGRTTKNVTFKDRATNNFEYTVYANLPEYLKECKNVTVYQSLCAFEVITLNGHRVFATHGDIFRSTTPANLRNALNQHQQASQFDSAVMGHFHSSTCFDYNKGTIFINGSLIGSNEYSALAMGAYSVPKQWLFGVCRDRITWQYVIECDHTPSKDGAVAKAKEVCLS